MTTSEEHKEIETELKNPKKTNGKYICPSEGCEYQFNFKKDLRKHYEIHNGPVVPKIDKIAQVTCEDVMNNRKKYYCTFEGCTKSYLNGDSFKYHMNRHTGTKPYACSICSNRFYRRYKLTLHELRHKGIKNFKCEHCAREFYDRSRLMIHYKTCKPTFKCGFSRCEKTFNKESRYTRHAKRHMYDDEIKRRGVESGTEKKKYDCVYCGNVYASKTRYDQHVAKWHPKKVEKKKIIVNITLEEVEALKTKKCPCCGKASTSNSNTKSHIKQDHFNIRDHVCVCGWASAYKASLDTHRKQCEIYKKL